MSPLSAFNRRFRSLSVDTQGWIICSAVLLVTVVRCDLAYSFGTFIVKLQSGENHTALAVQNWIGTLPFALSMTLSPISVLLIRSLGQQGYQIAAVAGVLLLTVSCFLSSAVAQGHEMWLFLTYSALYGIGSSLIYMSSSLVIGEYFGKAHKHHVLATSILLCGYPVGSLLFNPINGWLVDDYGVRVAFIVSGCIILTVGLPCCLTFLSRPDSDTNDPIDYGNFKRRMNTCCNPRQWFARPEIFLWLLGNLMSYAGYSMPFVNLAYYMKLKNIALAQSKWVLTILSLAECVTYAIASAVGDYFKGRLVLVNLTAAVGLSITYFVWPFVDGSYGAIMALSIVLGGFLGLTIAYQYAATVEVTRLPIDTIWGATNFWSGVGILVGPLFSGVIFDVRHSFNDVWFVTGGLYLAQALVFGSISVIWLCRTGSFVPDDYVEIIGDESTTDFVGDTAAANEAAATTAIDGSSSGAAGSAALATPQLQQQPQQTQENIQQLHSESTGIH